MNLKILNDESPLLMLPKIMDSATNLQKSHISHLLPNVAAGKTHNKDVDFDGVCKGPKIPPTTATIAQNFRESSLLSNVLQRVATLEGNLDKSKKRLKQALNVVRERDNEIVRLKEQIRLLEDGQKNKNFTSTTINDVSALVTLTESLQTRIAAVENFLKGDPYCWYKQEQSFNSDPLCQFRPSENYESPDLDLLLLQINELNFEASEIHICQNTKTGATFKGCQSVSLAFYGNGMQLEGHPFRDYSDLRTQFFIKDILDGFFPSELQCEYPSGVIFNVCDRRNEPYHANNESDNIFKGQGCRLDVKSVNVGNGMNLKKSKVHCVNCEDSKVDKEKCFTSNLQMSSDNSATQLLHLNKDFYKKRNLDSLSNNMHPSTGAGDGSFSMYRQKKNENSSMRNVTIKDGQVCSKKIKGQKTYKKNTLINPSRITHLNPGAKITNSSVQLKIRSINDRDVFILTMQTKELVGKLRSYLPDDVKDCNIMHYKDNYNRIYLTDNQLTLKECGILKNSVLVLSKPEFIEE